MLIGLTSSCCVVVVTHRRVAKKEFSNDPSEEISQISSLFQTDMAVLRSEAAQLTELSKTYAKQYSLLVKFCARDMQISQTAWNDRTCECCYGMHTLCRGAQRRSSRSTRSK